jgi:hypothetical protein
MPSDKSAGYARAMRRRCGKETIYVTLGAQRRRIEEAILAEPATDLCDIAIKVLVNSGEGSFALDDILILECAALASRDVAKMPRCLFEEVRAA